METPAKDTRSFFERIGDTLHSVLPFLCVKSLCRIDAAMTNRKGREGTWLPMLTNLTNFELILAESKGQDDVVRLAPRQVAATTAALAWLIARQVPLPAKLRSPYWFDPNDFLLCMARFAAPDNIREMTLTSKVKNVMHCTTGNQALISQGDPTAENLKILERCSELTFISTAIGQGVWKQLDEQDWKCFRLLTGIQSSDGFVESSRLNITSVTAEILKRRCPALTSIYFRCRSDNALKILADIATLEVVGIEDRDMHHGQEYREHITASGFSHLKKLPALRILRLTGCMCVDATLSHIKSVSTLRELRLSECKHLSAAGFVHIAESMTALTLLSLNECKEVTDADVAKLSGLNALEHFALASQAISGATLDALVSVKFLDVIGCDIDDIISLPRESLARIGRLHRLERLNISHNGEICTDPELLGSLLALTSLTALDVSGTGITDAGLDRLHGLARLECINLSFNSTVTEEAVTRLVAACPLLKVVDLTYVDLVSDAFKEALAKRVVGQQYPYHQV